MEIIKKAEKISSLIINSFHIKDVVLADKFKIDRNILSISTKNISNLIAEENLVSNIDLKIIKPDNHNLQINTIMDIIPISTKVLGEIGEGITYTLTGVYFMLTGIDKSGRQISDFGSSAGLLKDKIYFDRAGTPSQKDFIISFDVTLASGAAINRSGPIAIHRICDRYIQLIRNVLKSFSANKSDEKHIFYDKRIPSKKRVAIIKQVAGQGTMYDNLLFPDEPSGFKGGKSIIDLGNMPVILTPNEYRDGVLHAMT